MLEALHSDTARAVVTSAFRRKKAIKGQFKKIPGEAVRSIGILKSAAV